MRLLFGIFLGQSSVKLITSLYMTVITLNFSVDVPYTMCSDHVSIRHTAHT